jgi:hypothetical protein
MVFQQQHLIQRLAIGTLMYSSLACSSPAAQAECARLANAVGTAMSGLAVSNACSQDSDCMTYTKAISRDGQTCTFCSDVAIASASASDYESLLAADPNVDAACRAFLSAGCRINGSQGPGPVCPAVIPRCVSGTCQESID